MTNENKIIVTRHAVEQYRRRIVKDHNLNDNIVSRKVIKLFRQAKYVSDNQDGILFRNANKGIEFIVKQRKIVTLFPI